MPGSVTEAEPDYESVDQSSVKPCGFREPFHPLSLGVWRITIELQRVCRINFN